MAKIPPCMSSPRCQRHMQRGSPPRFPWSGRCTFPCGYAPCSPGQAACRRLCGRGRTSHSRRSQSRQCRSSSPSSARQGGHDPRQDGEQQQHEPRRAPGQCRAAQGASRTSSGQWPPEHSPPESHTGEDSRRDSTNRGAALFLGWWWRSPRTPMRPAGAAMAF